MGAITSWSARTFLKTILPDLPTNNLSSSLYQPWFNGPIHTPRVAIRNALFQSTSFEPSIRCWIRSPATYSVVQVPVLNRSKCFFMKSLHIFHTDACFRVLRDRRVGVVCRDIARFDEVPEPFLCYSTTPATTQYLPIQTSQLREPQGAGREQCRLSVLTSGMTKHGGCGQGGASKVLIRLLVFTFWYNHTHSSLTV